MTIEVSLRRRARKARWLAVVWLVLAVASAIGACFALPLWARIAASLATSNHDSVLSVSFLLMGFIIILIVCYMLARSAFVEIELAARFNGLADALCISGNDFGQFEKAATVFVPKPKYLSAEGKFSSKEIQAIADVLKQLR